MGTAEEIKNWSPDEINDYVLGRLDPKMAHQLEKDMMDDPFLQEAVEGYELGGGGLDAGGLNRKWDAQNQGAADSGQGILGGVAVGTVVVLALGIAWTIFQHKEVDLMAEQVQEAMVESRELEVNYEDSLQIMEIQLAIPIAEKEEIKAVQTILEQEEIKKLEVQQREEEGIIEPLTPLGVEDQKKTIEKKIISPEPEIFYSHDLKLADYRSDYKEELFLKGDFLGGTAAVYEREDNSLTQIAEIQRVGYEELMAEAMLKFAQRDYKPALVLLTRLEKKHPNDVNAAFYGGLCYYNLSKWKKADVRFRRAQNHPRKVFDQESEWYLALSLLKQMKNDRAESLLKEIVENEGFYAEKAAVLLGP